MKFEDLNFVEHPMAISARKMTKKDREMAGTMGDIKNAKQALWVVSDDLSVSVLFGALFYSNGIDTYEVWVTGTGAEKLSYRFNVPMGEATQAQVVDYIGQVTEEYDERS